MPEAENLDGIVVNAVNDQVRRLPDDELAGFGDMAGPTDLGVIAKLLRRIPNTIGD